MQLRLMGTQAEIAAALPAIKRALMVQEVSRPYLNRGDSQLRRVFLTVAGPAPVPTQAPAETNVPNDPRWTPSERADRPALPPAPGRQVRRR